MIVNTFASADCTRCRIVSYINGSLLNMRFLYLFVTLLLHQSLSGQSWERLQDFPGVERDDAAGFIIGDKGYVGTGLITGWQPALDFYSLDFSTGSWTQIASLPQGNERQYSTGFSGIGTGYVFGGVRGTTFLRDLWAYDPVTDQWSSKNSLPGKSRAGSAGFISGDKFYLVGGVDSSNQILDEVWIYDLSSEVWTQSVTPMPKGLWRSSAACLNGNGYLMFGKDSTGSYNKTLYTYDPGADTWTPVSAFPGNGRTYSSLVTIDDKLVVFGGLDSSGNSYNDLWIYDLNTCQQKTSLPDSQRRGGVAFPYRWDLYYITGINGQNVRLRDTWQLKTVTGIEERMDVRIICYPNPSCDRIIVRGNDSPEYSIYDQYGRKVKEGRTSNEGMININELSEGCYFLRVGEKWTQVVKIKTL